MADAEETRIGADDDDDQPTPKKKSRSKLIAIIAGVVILAIAAGGTFFLLKKKNSGDEAADAEAPVVADHGNITHDDQPPVYVKLDAFTTNLAAEGDQSLSNAAQYIQVVVEFKVEDAPAGEMLKNYMPEIRNSILRLLSGKKPSQLASTAGKDLLAEEIRDGVNGLVDSGSKKAGKGVHGPIVSVLFSSFIIQ
jgi:flagellar FliL protein